MRSAYLNILVASNFYMYIFYVFIKTVINFPRLIYDYTCACSNTCICYLQFRIAKTQLVALFHEGKHVCTCEHKLAFSQFKMLYTNTKLLLIVTHQIY